MVKLDTNYDKIKNYFTVMFRYVEKDVRVRNRIEEAYKALSYVYSFELINIEEYNSLVIFINSKLMNSSSYQN